MTILKMKRSIGKVSLKLYNTYLALLFELLAFEISVDPSLSTNLDLLMYNNNFSFEIEKDEPHVNETTAEFFHVCEGYLKPDEWENITCEAELDGVSSDKFGCEKDLEVSDFNEGPLLDDFSFNHETPDMDCFKETFASSQSKKETNRDDLPLYQDSPVRVGESSLLLMAFAVRHRLSGVALEDLLELIHFHCPKPNNCITELKDFHLFFQALKHPILKHFYCPNVICKVYIGTSQPKTGAKCAVCGSPLNLSSYFVEIPILEQLKTILSRKFSTLLIYTVGYTANYKLLVL